MGPILYFVIGKHKKTEKWQIISNSTDSLDTAKSWYAVSRLSVELECEFSDFKIVNTCYG